MSVDLEHGRHRRPHLPDRPWVPALGSLLLAGVFLALLLLRAGGDPSLLVHAGPPWTDGATAPSSLTVQDADRAFDGQFFYRLGVDPWSTDETVAGVTFDLPSLRNARWGYGALAWASSGGNPDLVPWSLIAVNLGAAAALGGLGGSLARGRGRHAAWGLLFALWPGFAYSLSLDTSELLATVFVLAGLLAARRRRWAATAAVLTLAVLVRDTAAVVPFGFALAGSLGWWRGRDRRSPRNDEDRSPADASPSDEGRLGPLLAGLAPLAVFGFWQLLQRARFGELPLTSSGDNNLSAPLLGFVRLLRTAVEHPGGEAFFRAGFGIALLLLIGLTAFTLRRSGAPDAHRFAWLGAVAVVVLLNTYLWSGATAFMRASTEAGVLSIAILLGAGSLRGRLLPVLATGLAGGWLLTAAVQVVKLG